MSRSLKVHERKDTVKWVLVALALLVVGAILCGLMTDWFQEFNPFCWFGHSYGDDGICTRCKAEKPLDKPEPEAQMLVSEPYLMFAAANSLNATANSAATKTDDVSKYTVTSSASCQLLVNGKAINSNISIDSNEEFTLAVSFAGHDYGSDWEIYYACYSVEGSGVWYKFPDTTSQYPISEKGTYLVCWVFEQGSGDDCYCMRSQIYTVEYANKQELPPAPVKTGYTFTGWYTDEACTNKYTDDKVYGDITLYAGFQANTYSIKFNANSGSGEMANLAMTYDTAKALTANGFTKEHYAFKGWARSADGEVVYADNAEVNNLTAEDNATVELFAVWERSEVCVTFVSESDTVATTWIAIGTKATLPDNPVKEGHLFNGWCYEDGSKYTEQNISEDITLTAKFDIIRCTVTFIVDGEVYAVYVCDWGTSIAQALNGAGVNTVLYEADEHSANF